MSVVTSIGTCLECGHTSGCDCDCCPYSLPAVCCTARPESCEHPMTLMTDEIPEGGTR